MVEDQFVEEMLVTTLRFWIKKIKRGDCTREQELTILNALEAAGGTYGTLEEIADFYGKSRDDVSGVIHRNNVGKPKRNIVMYSFSKISRVVPKSWRKVITNQ